MSGGSLEPGGSLPRFELGLKEGDSHIHVPFQAFLICLVELYTDILLNNKAFWEIVP